jgi:PmbA protein
VSERGDATDIARTLVNAALAAGADAADAMVAEGTGLEVGIRLGEPEKLVRSRDRRAGLRVLLGRATAIVSSADVTAATLTDLASQACALARATAPDEHAGLPDPSDLAGTLPELDLWDDAVDALEPEAGFDLARTAEQAALEAAPEITNSEGAEFGGGGGVVAYASSLGFSGAYRRSSFSLSVVPVATRDGAMQRDSWWTASHRLARLDAPGDVGREAARRTLRRLGAQQVPTGEYPVVFDPQMAASLLRHLAGAIAGPSLYRRASFLLDRKGERIAAEGVTIVDDPLLPDAPGSRPFDGEGVTSRRTTIVENGVLQSYLLDSYSARRLGLRTTGHAVRSPGDAPTVSPTNFFLAAGPHTPEEIIGSVERGLYVTELIGFGVNTVTGDYSRGAVGLWIEDGRLTHAVEEITIAGSLPAMLNGITMIGNDLVFRSAVTAPTLKIDRLTVAGR